MCEVVEFPNKDKEKQERDNAISDKVGEEIMAMTRLHLEQLMTGEVEEKR